MTQRRTRRRRSREIAFQTLYQTEHGQDSAVEALGQILASRKAGPDVAEYAASLVDIYARHGGEIDRRIREVLDRWEFDRLASVDRAVLRVAVGEILHRPDVPAEVVIDEAVDIAKRYSTENSGAFVNGILDRIRRSVSDAEGRAEG
jgi:transcription antitermination factor NusB